MAHSKLAATVLSTKGQVILPKEIRDQKQWGPGVRLIVESTPEGVLLRPERAFPPSAYEDVRGSLAPHVKKTLSEDEIDAALRAAAKRRHARD